MPKDARTIDLSGYTVMPGLIDTHVHLTLDPNVRWNPVTETREYAVAITLHHAETLARAGFTTVRDLGPDQFFSQATRDAVAAGLHPGPRIIAAAKLSIIGGHGEPARMNPRRSICPRVVRAGVGQDRSTQYHSAHTQCCEHCLTPAIYPAFHFSTNQSLGNAVLRRACYELSIFTLALFPREGDPDFDFLPVTIDEAGGEFSVTALDSRDEVVVQ